MALCVREGGSGAISTSPWCVETSRRLELVEDDPFESSEGFCVIDVLALVCLLHLGFCFIRQKARIHLTYHSDCKRTQPPPAWQEGDHQGMGCFFSDCRAAAALGVHPWSVPPPSQEVQPRGSTNGPMAHKWFFRYSMTRLMGHILTWN